MDPDDLQRTRHNAKILAENAGVLYEELRTVGLPPSTIDGMMTAYFKAILEGAQVQQASNLLANLVKPTQ